MRKRRLVQLCRTILDPYHSLFLLVCFVLFQKKTIAPITSYTNDVGIKEHRKRLTQFTVSHLYPFEAIFY